MILGEDSPDIVATNTFGIILFKCQDCPERIDKLEKACSRCKLTGNNGGCIEFLGYTPETEALLETERQDVTQRSSGVASEAGTDSMKTKSIVQYLSKTTDFRY